MKTYRILIALLAADLLVVTGWAFIEDPVFPSILYIFSNSWGIQTALDLLLGLVLVSSVIYYAETSKAQAWAWISFLFLGGNLVSALYFVVKFNEIKARLQGPQLDDMRDASALN